MSIASEIARLQSAKSAIASAIADKGVTVPAATKLDGYPALIGQIHSGVTPSGTKEITANGIYDVASFASASVSVSPRLQSKIVMPSTTSAVVSPDAGYDGLSRVTVNAVTSAIDANIVAGNIKKNVTILGVTGTLEGGGEEDIVDGLITRNISSITNSRVTTIGSYAFYSYRSLTTASFPACTTIGASAFNNCSSLTTASFPSCTSIGSYAFYSCSSLTTVSFPACTTIGTQAFCYCSRLTTASFPACTTIGSDAFDNCSRLTTASFPACTTIGSYAFYGCRSLTTVSFPSCNTIGSYAFCNCYSLTTASFPSCNTIGSYAFRNCSRIVSLYLTGSSLCSLANSNAFSSTPIGDYSTIAGQYGSIYVPASLLTQYKSATNWTYFSSRFVGI